MGQPQLRFFMKFLLSLLALGILAAPLGGEPAEAAAALRGGLSLDDCLQLASEKQPQLAAAQAGIAAAREGVGEARTAWYPQFDLSAGYHRWQRRAYLPAGLLPAGRTAPTVLGPQDDWNGGATARYTLYDFGERRATIEAAAARVASAEADADTARSAVRLGVRTAFYALAAANDLREVAVHNLARLGEHVRLATARHEAGAVPHADVLRTRAELASAKLELISADNRVRIAGGRLNTALGRPAETPLTITAPAPDTIAAPVDPAAGVAQALKRRPELQAAEKQVAAVGAQLAAARSTRAPRLRADGSFGWRDDAFLPETQEWQAGVTVEVPLFDAGLRSRRIAHSRADLARQNALREQRELQVREEVWTAASDLERARAAITANEALVQQSDESVRVTRARYEAGSSTITDLLDTQIALARAEASLAGARWDVLAARAVYARACGIVE